MKIAAAQFACSGDRDRNTENARKIMAVACAFKSHHDREGDG